MSVLSSFFSLTHSNRPLELIITYSCPRSFVSVNKMTNLSINHQKCAHVKVKREVLGEFRIIIAYWQLIESRASCTQYGRKSGANNRIGGEMEMRCDHRWRVGGMNHTFSLLSFPFAPLRRLSSCVFGIFLPLIVSPRRRFSPFSTWSRLSLHARNEARKTIKKLGTDKGAHKGNSFCGQNRIPHGVKLIRDESGGSMKQKRGVKN